MNYDFIRKLAVKVSEQEAAVLSETEKAMQEYYRKRKRNNLVTLAIVVVVFLFLFLRGIVG